jgi:hypothetical protein
MSPESEAAAADRARQLKEALELMNDVAGCQQRIVTYEREIEYLLDVKEIDFSLGLGNMHVNGKTQIPGPYKVHLSEGKSRRHYETDIAFQIAQTDGVRDIVAIALVNIIEELRSKISAEEDSIIMLMNPVEHEDS